MYRGLISTSVKDSLLCEALKYFKLQVSTRRAENYEFKIWITTNTNILLMKDDKIYGKVLKSNKTVSTLLIIGIYE